MIQVKANEERNPDGHVESDKQSHDKAAAVLAELSTSFSAELNAKSKRLHGLIGENHWQSVGNYRESILRYQFREALPSRFTVGTGFTIGFAPSGAHSLGTELSKQIDILIWDNQDYAPIFTDGDFAIVQSKSCRCGVEVKSTLTHAELKKGLTNLESVSSTLPTLRAQNCPNPCMFLFGYALGKNVSFPSGVLRALHNCYSNDVERWQRYRKNENSPFSQSLLPLVKSVVILGKGVVYLTDCWVKGRSVPAYVAFKKKEGNSEDDAFGFMLRTMLVLSGLNPFNVGLDDQHTHFLREIFNQSYERIPRNSILLVSEPQIDVTSWDKNTDSTALAVAEREVFRP